MALNYVFPCFIQPSNKLQMLVRHCSMFLLAFLFLISGNSECYRGDGMMGDDMAEKQITLCVSCIFSYQTPKLTWRLNFIEDNSVWLKRFNRDKMRHILTDIQKWYLAHFCAVTMMLMSGFEGHTWHECESVSTAKIGHLRLPEQESTQKVGVLLAFTRMAS